jgi:hypothetical protein
MTAVVQADARPDCRLNANNKTKDKIFGGVVLRPLNNHTGRPKSSEYYENLSGLIFSADSADSLSYLCSIAWRPPPFAQWLDNAEPPCGEHEYQSRGRGNLDSAEGEALPIDRCSSPSSRADGRHSPGADNIVPTTNTLTALDRLSIAHKLNRAKALKGNSL